MEKLFKLEIVTPDKRFFDQEVSERCGGHIHIGAQYLEELGLPCYLTREEALSMTNKLYMKKLMVENNIPTSKFKKIRSRRNERTVWIF